MVTVTEQVSARSLHRAAPLAVRWPSAESGPGRVPVSRGSMCRGGPRDREHRLWHCYGTAASRTVGAEASAPRASQREAMSLTDCHEGTEEVPSHD